jgi:hypothetical protein
MNEYEPDDPYKYDPSCMSECDECYRLATRARSLERALIASDKELAIYRQKHRELWDSMQADMNELARLRRRYLDAATAIALVMQEPTFQDICRVLVEHKLLHPQSVPESNTQTTRRVRVA